MTKVKEAPVSNETTSDKLSKEEIIKRRVEVTNFYKENIKHLKVQLEYEQLLTDIEKLRAERLQAQAFLAQAYASPEDQQESSDAGQDFEAAMESSGRTLKRK